MDAFKKIYDVYSFNSINIIFILKILRRNILDFHY
jgi:hypothetical protein